MKSLLYFVVFSLFLSCQNQELQISQWRGDNRSGVYQEENLLDRWPENGPDLIWSIDGIGEGYSSASVSEEAMYLTGLIDTLEYVTALDLDGKQLWQTEFGPGWNTNFNASRSTPTLVGDHVFVIGGQGHIACLNRETGAIIWNMDAYNKFEGEWDIWGVAESPLYHDGKIFYTPCGEKTTMVALDANSGKTIWESTSLPDSSAYVSPVLINHGERELIVTVTSNYIIALDPEDGKIVWKKTYSDIHP
ncbi:MAG: PQQ-like beta-propeller repeat protein, partial [Cyclobacteriaceae bacterium]|nr:PQQ-like beta-propeller repeat protein [Cyclobacteriaceae bacterium]